MTYTRAALSLAAALFLATGTQAADQQLIPRTALPKKPSEKLVMPADATGDLIIKFVDQVRARPTPEGGLRATQPVDAATLILERFGLKTVNAYPGISEQRLAALEARAARVSGKAQPDLAGMMRVTGPAENLEAAAKALNDLDTVEFVRFDRALYPGGDTGLFTPRNQINQVAARLRAERAAKSQAAPAEYAADKLPGDMGGDPQEASGVFGCCIPTNNTCLDVAAPADCTGLGGVLQPSTCDGGPCGACCLDSGCSAPLHETACTDFQPDASWFAAQDCDTACQPGACCLPGDECQLTPSRAACEDLDPDGLGGFFQGFGVDCEDAECDLDCGQSPQECFDPAGGGNLPYCSDPACCNVVCNIDPFCCEPDGGAWDQLCAATANLVCTPHTPNWDEDLQIPVNDPPMGPDRCASPWNLSCFELHPVGGCNNQACCNTVCLIEEICCTDDWDELCVEVARSECADGTVPGGETPSFVGLQGYLTEEPYAGLTTFGRGGEGWNLTDAGEPFTDLNGDMWWNPGEPYIDGGRNGIPGDDDEGDSNGRWDPPSGLFGIAEQLLREYHINGTGQGNLTHGATTKIGVIEWGWWPGHEDLTHVRTERGQTIIQIPEIAFNDHGTACLSIMNAAENGFGVTGIVPQAEGWFFPISSVEDGARELSAWIAAMEEFGAGDVISASYGPVGGLNVYEDTWTLFRLASDLGISVFIAAGNGCDNLDDFDDFGDSGATVVGACSPGFPWFRLAFSNFSTNPPIDNSIGNMVHVRAWGSDVAAAGYGDLQTPANGDSRRLYTGSFGGTSAASPQVAGLSAALQGLAKQFYGIPIAPERLRAVLGTPGIPPENPVRLFGGFPDDAGCGLDLDPDLGPNWIGNYPETVFSAGNITGQNAGGFDDSPRLDDVQVVRGDRIRGNRFSVKGNDEVYLSYDAIYTKPGDQPVSNSGLGRGVGSGIAIPEVADIDYIASGEMTDIVFVGHSDIDIVNTLIIENHVQYPNIFNVMVVELYDHRREQFAFVDFVVDPTQAFAIEEGTGDLIFAHVAQSTSRFISRDDNRIVGRIWTIGFPNTAGFGIGGGDDSYRMRVDLLNIFVSENFGETLPGGG